MDLEYLQEQAGHLIPAPDNTDFLYKKNHTTLDIINLMLYADQRLSGNMCDFAQLFPKTKKGLRDLWEFVHETFIFKVDPDNDEQVISPRVLWNRKHGNCKSYSTFIASILKCNGIKYKYAFPVFPGESSTRHVYIIAYLNGEEIVLDSTINKFNYAENFISRKEIEPKMSVRYLDGPLKQKRKKVSLGDAFKEAPLQLTQKRFFDYSNQTNGQFLLDQIQYNLEINKNYYGDPTGDFQNKLDIVNDFKNKLHSINPDTISAPVLEQYKNLFYWLKKANNDTTFAGTNFGIRGNGINDPSQDAILELCQVYRYFYLIYIQQLDPLTFSSFAQNRTVVINTVGYKKTVIKLAQGHRVEVIETYSWAKPFFEFFDGTGKQIAANDVVKNYQDCDTKSFFIDEFNTHMEDMAPHLCYEFLDPYPYQGRGHEILIDKTLRHKSQNDNFSLYGTISRDVVTMWENNGIQNKAALLKLVDITPPGFIGEIARQANAPAKVGEIFTLITIIATALLAAQKLVDAFILKKTLISDHVKDAGSPTFGPSLNDWAGLTLETAKQGKLTIPGLVTGVGVYLVASN